MGTDPRLLPRLQKEAARLPNHHLLDHVFVACGEPARRTLDVAYVVFGHYMREWEVPESGSDAPKVGVDVGLSVVAATSDGRLYGSALKPEFDRQYQAVRSVRANRQRQGLFEDSPRLARLEGRLSGLVKTVTSTVANQLVADHPGAIFVLEDLDLRGSRGQKRST